jgi:hypothetical protein
MDNSKAPPELSLKEIYTQAHETRRKWENYIWQWNIVLTILAAVFVQFAPSLSGSTTDTEHTLTSIYFSWPQKMVLSLIALFVLAIFFNVFRARVLMKELEKTISSLHNEIGFTLPVVPLELDKSLPLFKRISSTKLSTYCHLAAVIVFISIAIYAWCK